LGEGAKYDVSCSSSGSFRKHTTGGTGNAAPSGVCHTFTADGRCISLLKILLTNACSLDCAYCINRRSNDIARASFSPEEAARLTIDFYRRNYIEGLFLSSAVLVSPDHTMELMVKTAELLRKTYFFNGYIHMKGIPGASPGLIDRAGRLVDRMSINMEMADETGLKLLAPDKRMDDIKSPMEQIKKSIELYGSERKILKSAPVFVPAGQSTQLIIGAVKETDKSIVTLTERLYSGMKLKRVYYSAYVHVNNDKRLSLAGPPRMLLENRLYQADWLMRFYGFSADEILDDADPYFDARLDPKSAWALRNLRYFPVEIKNAAYEELLRVPGIGVKSARRLIAARRVKLPAVDDLKKLGVVIKRAKYFLTVNGYHAAGINMREKNIRQGLLEKGPSGGGGQLELFAPPAAALPGFNGAGGVKGAGA
jgi:putative DNA modification/repair radical SAM protein